MTGLGRLAAAVLLGALLAVTGLWFSQSNGAGRPAAPGEARAGIDDLLRSLEIIPLGGRRPPAFTLPSLDGAPRGLGDLRGRPALLYFWATW
jgi:hypothetical protein